MSFQPAGCGWGTAGICPSPEGSLQVGCIQSVGSGSEGRAKSRVMTCSDGIELHTDNLGTLTLVYCEH